MPELPEMENYRKLLDQLVVKQLITGVTINREKSINIPVEDFKEEVEKAVITSVERRAKHLIFRLNSGKVLVLHLMLGGWLYFGDENDSPNRTKQVIISFGNNNKLYFIGLRLGYLHLHPSSSVSELFHELGPEPLDDAFTYDHFLSITKSRKSRLKTLLVDQKFISGIGNCYSDEICFYARLFPGRKINELNAKELEQLYQAIPAVLNRALLNGGYMEHPLFQADSKTGNYDKHAYVYDRDGQACPRCQGTIQRDEISSRKTFYCNSCQL